MSDAEGSEEEEEQNPDSGCQRSRLGSTGERNAGEIPREAALKGKAAQGSWQVFKDSILQAQEWPILITRRTNRHLRRQDG